MRHDPDAVKPKILIDGRPLLDPRSGGVFEYARHVVDGLRSDPRLDVRVWANAARIPAPPPDVDVLTRWPNKLLHLAQLATGRPTLPALAPGGADLVWMPNLHVAAPTGGLPLAVTVHDLSFERYPEFLSLKRRLWHRAARPAALLRRAAAVLAVSNFTKSEIVHAYGIPPERIAVTPEGVDAAFFASPSPSDLAVARERLRLPRRFILHVGALEPRKNLTTLLDAFHQLKRQGRFSELGLVLAGPAGWKNGEFLRAVRLSPFRRDIRSLGFVDEHDRRALYRLASVFAFPSFYEGFGLPPLEAMASGAPVVASFAGALGEVVGDAGLLIDPYRPGELADALSAVLDSPALAERMGARGRVRAARFRWETCVASTSDALLAVM